MNLTKNLKIILMLEIFFCGYVVANESTIDKIALPEDKGEKIESVQV